MTRLGNAPVPDIATLQTLICPRALSGFHFLANENNDTETRIRLSFFNKDQKTVFLRYHLIFFQVLTDSFQ